jgi:response regulator NasT
MENALIVSNSAKSVAFFTDMLNAAGCKKITVWGSGGEARRLFSERDFDLVIVNVPLPDESGESLSRHIASKGSAQVILVVNNEFFDAMSAVTEDDGILVVAKPVDRNVFWSTLKLAKSAQSRLKKIQAENSKLKQKIDDIRIIDRAKCLLMSHLNMSEQDAHRFIEKQAMDMRTTRRKIAEGVLRTYE